VEQERKWHGRGNYMKKKIRRVIEIVKKMEKEGSDGMGMEGKLKKIRNRKKEREWKWKKMRRGNEGRKQGVKRKESKWEWKERGGGKVR